MLDCADLSEAVAVARRVEQWRPDVVDVVAASRSVLVTTSDATFLPELRRRLGALVSEPPARLGDPAAAVAGGAGPERREVEIDVRYDGPDLAEVSELAGLPTQELVRRHTSITWSAAFGGFAPGFFYLVDERELLGRGERDARSPTDTLTPDALIPDVLPPVPRLASPRARVPPGAVGLADRFCAVYPGASPGGWRLLGTTDAVLWDANRPAPALLAPGMRVRFRQVIP